MVKTLLQQTYKGKKITHINNQYFVNLINTFLSVKCKYNYLFEQYIAESIKLFKGCNFLSSEIKVLIIKSNIQMQEKRLLDKNIINKYKNAVK